MVNMAHIVDHIFYQPAFRDTPERLAADEIWDSIEKYGLKEYTIV
jgi:hypothetical protein